MKTLTVLILLALSGIATAQPAWVEQAQRQREADKRFAEQARESAKRQREVQRESYKRIAEQRREQRKRYEEMHREQAKAHTERQREWQKDQAEQRREWEKFHAERDREAAKYEAEMYREQFNLGDGYGQVGSYTPHARGYVTPGVPYHSRYGVPTRRDSYGAYQHYGPVPQVTGEVMVPHASHGSPDFPLESAPSYAEPLPMPVEPQFFNSDVSRLPLEAPVPEYCPGQPGGRPRINYRP